MNIWKDWLIQQPKPFKYTKFSHYEFVENSDIREQIKGVLAKIINDYHTRTRNYIDLLGKLGYPETAKVLRGNQRPESLCTRKAHLGEILGCEFVKEFLNFEIPIFRFYYNPNPEQSMKGDDILGFDFSSTPKQVIVGESKYRTQFASSAVNDAYCSLSKLLQSYPISIEFVYQILKLESNIEKAEKVKQIQQKLLKDKNSINRNYLILLATKGRPRDPFNLIEEKDNVLENLTAINIVFEESIEDFINQIYEKEIKL